MPRSTTSTLVALAGVAALVYLASKSGPNKRPSVDGLPVWVNGNGPVREPGEGGGGRAYCGVDATKWAC